MRVRIQTDRIQKSTPADGGTEPRSKRGNPAERGAPTVPSLERRGRKIPLLRGVDLIIEDYLRRGVSRVEDQLSLRGVAKLRLVLPDIGQAGNLIFAAADRFEIASSLRSSQ